MDELVKKIVGGDKRSAAKAITIIENNKIDEKNQLLGLLYPYTGKAKVIGITGPPGAGKSTLVDGIIQQVRDSGLTIGVLAVDPSSPYTGGAILGDRVRMQRHATDLGVFIRSMGSRGKLGGVSHGTRETIYVLDAMGMDVILIETVGVGQSELEIMDIADTTIVVLHPGSGDSIQAFKAGIMEIADIFVVNKSDLFGSQKLVHEIEMLLSLTKHNSQWKPVIVATIASTKDGIDKLWEQISNHFNYLLESGLLEDKRNKNKENDLIEKLYELYMEEVRHYQGTEEYHELLHLIFNKKKSPLEIAKVAFDRLKDKR